MKPINKLKEILAVNLTWDKRRIDCFAKLRRDAVAES